MVSQTEADEEAEVRRGDEGQGGIVDPLNPSRRGFMSMAGTAAIGAMGVAGANTLIALNNGAKADGEPIPVGAMLPYTGWGAEDSRNFEAGITLAVEEINSYGGIHGRPIEVHYEDTKEITAETVTSAARRLIDRHEVHAIINGYNSLSVRAEYDTIADAGIPYMHDNTQYGHQFAVRDNPDRYWCIFQDDPSEYYYGSGLIYFLDELEKLGKWKRPNNKFVLFSGSIDYAITIAAAVRDTAPQFGWELAIDDVVTQPVDDWGPALVRARELEPAIIAATHGFPTDQTGLVTGFAENPTNSLVYVQYALQQRAFLDIVKETGQGVFCSTTIGNPAGRDRQHLLEEDSRPVGRGHDPDGRRAGVRLVLPVGDRGVPRRRLGRALRRHRAEQEGLHAHARIDLSRRGGHHQVHVGPGSAALSGGDTGSLARDAHDHDAVSGLDQGRGLRRAGSLRHGRLDDPALAHKLEPVTPNT